MRWQSRPECGWAQDSSAQHVHTRFIIASMALSASLPCNRSLDMLEDTVEFVQGVIVDDELAFAGRGVLHVYFGAQLFAQFAFQLLDVRIGARGRFARF